MFGCSTSPDNGLPFETDDFVEVYKHFGKRRKFHPVLGLRPRFHKSISIQLKEGAKVYSVYDGVVVSVPKVDRPLYGFGKSIIIKHQDSIAIRYHHLNDIYVKEGEQLKKWDDIGLSGNTGLITVNGVGIQVHINDSLVNPADHLPALAELE
ncbi:MAG: M23 family metallopeptidase [Bacteroidia bacterium]